MDISGIVQSYDSRASSSAPVPRTIAGPHYMQQPSYTTGPAENMVMAQHGMPVHHQPFNFNSFHNQNINILVPALPENYMPARPPRLAQPGVDEARSYAPSSHQSYVDDFHNQALPIKPEPLWSPSTNSSSSLPSRSKNSPRTAIGHDTRLDEVSFDTEVDTLMKAIQAKSQTAQASQELPHQAIPRGLSQPSHYGAASSKQDSNTDPQDDFRSGKRRFQCPVKNCMKSFYQKTHLDIHERAHTGFKPYACKEPSCGRSFSQLGNLRTHERRHTGERPYQCEICGKRFAQRGNVRAHGIVHEQAKPYLCRLDQCGKKFTQLGNLKSHQNKFHAQTIRDLTSKFASIRDGDFVASADKELWEYFANLYKNSNKGIKGRGKDRKVGASPVDLGPNMRSLHVSNARWPRRDTSESYIRAYASMNPNLKAEDQYGMYEGDDGSQSGSRSGAGSSVEPYDDGPSDEYDDAGRVADLAFGDRIY